MPEQEAPEQPGLLSQLRSSWAFASLMQYIAIFGQVMKIDEEFGIEVCLVPSLRPDQCCALCRIDGNIPKQTSFGWICADNLVHPTLGPRSRMPQARTLTETIGDWVVSAQVDLIPSWSYVRKLVYIARYSGQWD